MAIMFSTTGCFEERSFPMREQDVVRLSAAEDLNHNAEESTREWLAHTHGQLERVLTPRGHRVLLTEQMTCPTGKPVDTYAYFQKDPRTLTCFRHNWWGILHTAQSVSRNLFIEKPAPAWPGFEDVWVPVDTDVKLAARLGFSVDADGTIRDADCIVILPGYLGDNGIQRTRDLAIALRARGFHVLALELRGHGQTENKQPDVYYTFGVLETQDLLRVSRWLQDKFAHVRRTGLIGFCWGGNLGMLAGWFDGAGRDHASVGSTLRPYLEPASERRHFTAGIMAFGPVIDWEGVVERTDTERSIVTDPTTYFFQDTVRNRMECKHFGEICGSLRHLIDYEFRHSVFGPGLPMMEAYRFLRFLPHRGLPADDKMESVRVPMVIISSVNDPFLNAQDLPDLMTQTRNRMVAGVVLRGGGHIGFAPYNRPYYYSLILNFFDPQSGAAASVPQRPILSASGAKTGGSGIP